MLHDNSTQWIVLTLVLIFNVIVKLVGAWYPTIDVWYLDLLVGLLCCALWLLLIVTSLPNTPQAVPS
jgi:hypothetical protein